MFSLTVSGSVAFGLSGMLFDEFCASSTVAAKELGVSSIAISCMAQAGTTATETVIAATEAVTAIFIKLFGDIIVSLSHKTHFTR